MKIFYHLDNDGKCAAYLVKKFVKSHGDIECIKINYGIRFPFEKIAKDEVVYIVDYSIIPNEMDRLLEITENVTWIDHHVTAINKYENYSKEIRGLRHDGIAGCMLTYCYLKYMTDNGIGKIKPFNTDMVSNAPYFVKLIADHDVWTFKFGDDTRNFQKGFELYNHEPCDSIWKSLEQEDVITEIIEAGEIITKYRKSMMASYCNSKGFEAKLDGYNCFAINMALVGSDDFVIDNVNDYDILVSFSYDGDVWNYSLRSTKLDCSKIAVGYGGGGHRGAAGFNSHNFILKKI